VDDGAAVVFGAADIVDVVDVAISKRDVAESTNFFWR